MADSKISALPSASLPLAGTEVLPIVQSSATVKVPVDDLTVKNIRSNATTGLLQVTGPSAGTTRVMTTPNANFTAARTDAAQTFTGQSTFSNGLISTGQVDLTVASYAIRVINGSANPLQCPSVGTGTGTAAIWDANGALYKLSSSARYKENIEPMVVTDDQITAFLNTQPSFWDYKKIEGSESIPTKGAASFIAEDLAVVGVNRYGKSVFTNYDNEDRPDSNRDYAIIAMQHLVIQKHEQRIAALEQSIADLLAAK